MKYLKQEGNTAITHKETLIELSTYFATEVWHARKEWQDILKVMK